MGIIGRRVWVHEFLPAFTNPGYGTRTVLVELEDSNWVTTSDGWLVSYS